MLWPKFAVEKSQVTDWPFWIDTVAGSKITLFGGTLTVASAEATAGSTPSTRAARAGRRSGERRMAPPLTPARGDLFRRRCEDEALGLVAGALDELAHLGGALAPLAEHVGGDDVRIGRVGPPDADPHAVEVRRRRARA